MTRTEGTVEALRLRLGAAVEELVGGRLAEFARRAAELERAAPDEAELRAAFESDPEAAGALRRAALDAAAAAGHVRAVADLLARRGAAEVGYRADGARRLERRPTLRAEA